MGSTRTRADAGFSLIELLIATGVLLIVSSIATNALMEISKHQQTVWNRTEMHSGIRGATELLQQEVGQAGRVALPSTVTLHAAINDVGGAAPSAVSTCDPSTPSGGAATVQVDSSVAGVNAVSGMFAATTPTASYIMLTTFDGDNQESVRVASVNAL